jgi:hypothetical protein
MPRGIPDPNKPRPPVPVPDGEEAWSLTGEHRTYGVFATALLVVAGRVYSAPPLFADTRGKPVAHLIPYAEEKGWTLQPFSGPTRQRLAPPLSATPGATAPASRCGLGESSAGAASWTPTRARSTTLNSPPRPGGSSGGASMKSGGG